jgi:hypothetical protein
MIKLQAQRTPAALTNPAVAGKNNPFGVFGNITALRKTGQAE